jgi:hypothetical protein
MSTYMKKHQRQCLKLRIAVTIAAVLGLGLLYSPTIMMVNDAFAQPTPTTQPATKTPTATPKVETKGTVTVTETKKDEPKADAKDETKKDDTAAAPASDKEQAWWQAVLVPVLSVLGLFIAGFLAAGLRKLVQLIEKKWNVDIPDSFERLMIEKAKWALGWAEEQAEKKLLYEGGAKTEGAKKVGDVVDMLFEFADKAGYGEEWGREKIQKLAEGVLHLERDQTIGSTGDRATKLEEAKNGNGNG